MDARTVRQRLLNINRERLNRVKHAFRWRQRDFLDLLPLLIHFNNRDLPGYIGEECAKGISNFTPPKVSLEAAKRLNKNFTYKKRLYKRYDIYSVFLTGSTGTIAQSERSDFDVWVCHRPDLDDAKVSLLRHKCELISEWAASLGLEAHLFVIDEVGFRLMEHGDVSSESSGSAQHHLLLDEFYRSSLLLAGRYPVWWLVPPDEEANYEEYVGEMQRKRIIPDYETVDFGGLARIPPEEFLGASLWQIFKGIDSPYKSVLKILLMEAYSAEYPNNDLLSIRFKRKIYEGVVDLNQLDPYIMMCNKVEEHLLQLDERERLELARRCFYFKIDLKLSIPAGRSNRHDWRRELMRQLTETWGWDDAQLLMLDSRPKWKVNRVLDERKALVDELTHSYQLLSRFAKNYAGLAMISGKDMTVLGRKLYAAFERKAGKIEFINPGISPNLIESHLSIHQQTSSDGNESWVLYRGMVDLDSAKRARPLKRALSCTEIVAWCYFNDMLDMRTVISLHASGSEVSVSELRNIIDSFRREFPEGCLERTNMEDLEKPSRNLITVVFVNVGQDPKPRRTLQGTQIVSSRSDALSYSGLLENLVLGFDQVALTSWHEIVTQKFNGIHGILDSLGQYLRSCALAPDGDPPIISAFSYSSALSVTIAQRVRELFENVYRCYFESHDNMSARYVFNVESGYYMLRMSKGLLNHRRLSGKTALMRALEEPLSEYSNVVFDERALDKSPLPLVFAYNKPGLVQLFYHIDDHMVNIFVIDERGSLSAQTLPFYKTSVMLSQYDTFLYSVIQRQNVYMQTALGEAPVIDGSELFALHKQKDGSWLAERQRFDPISGKMRYFNIQVIIEISDSNTFYTIYCDDKEYSSLEHGENLFAVVADHIVNLRNHGEPYPLYITDIDLSRELADDEARNNIQTIHYLKYKTRIEGALNNALRDHGRAAQSL